MDNASGPSVTLPKLRNDIPYPIEALRLSEGEISGQSWHHTQ
jgi:hypothetical protein